MEFLDAVADMHPVAKFVVGSLSKLVKQERQRHENNAYIVVVITTMVNTVYHVRFLIRIPVRVEKEIKDDMEDICKDMVATITEFEAFVDTYHRSWQITYKVIFAHKHKKQVEHFLDRFRQHKERFEHMSMTVSQVQLVNLNLDVGRILEALEIESPDVKRAEDFINQHGGEDEVRKNPQLVDELASILGEKATPRLKDMLRQDFDEVLNKQTARYLEQLASVQNAVVSSVSDAQAAILSRLNEGPHVLIEDEEIRTIWERNVRTPSFIRWKSYVKSRIFVEGIHQHYQTKFHDHESDEHFKDAWTLPFFSRAMYHSAIGDIVDDDASGYLSASEVNEFISEKYSLRGSPWTNPQWFAFWACGWYNNNAWYHSRIKDILREMGTSLATAKIPEQARKPFDEIQLIVESLKPLARQNPSAASSPSGGSTQQENSIQSKLENDGYHISDKSRLEIVVGSTRIELHMMALLYELVKRLCDTIDKVVASNEVADEHLIVVEELATSCIVVFVAFEDRMRDLVRCWRFEGKDIEMQIDRFADGLFRRCYREVSTFEKAYDTLRGCIFGDDAKLPRHLRPFSSASRVQTSVDGLARQVVVLSERVQTLEERLKKVEQL
ncbi:hypothetical protein GY45DRAFT_1371175 [Cubamyces sp. BRFM 1775]|nr:hypothetical protein GY45DRAFT_1371175 [Cubamyces sp. BRFM 1775]